MSGIAGLWSPKYQQNDIQTSIHRMTDTLKHRGPDDVGFWVEPNSGIALGHRRLSIPNLSSAERQPVISACGRYVLLFDGKIFNYRRLREALGGDSDGEVLVAAVARWGFEEALKRCNGMFAIAVWDRERRALYLARDRMGEKPLYYGWQQGVFLFASELKALRVHPVWKGEIDRNSLALYFQYASVPAPHTIYRGIYKLLPAHWTVVYEGATSSLEQSPYWSISEVAMKGVSQPLSGSTQELADELEVRLRCAVAMRMDSGKPLGAFLSGGYDSSTVVSLMQAQSDRPVKTFSIGFHESGFNEAEYAKAIAHYLATDHNELYVTSEDALELIPKLPEIWDEPFSDSSQIPTYFLAAFTRRKVTVAFSGDGGDELFGGYKRYQIALRIWNLLSKLPGWARNLTASLADRSCEPISRMITPLNLPGFKAAHRMLVRGSRFSPLVRQGTAEDVYLHIISHWDDPVELVVGADNVEGPDSSADFWRRLPRFEERMMFLDMCTYLPNDILTKIDRASMAVSLDTRVPMLDHEVVEFAWQLPLNTKIRNGQGKWLLKEVLHRHIPQSLMNRSKMGFGVPIRHWLRGPLREWAEELIDEDRLVREGFLDPKLIRAMWYSHLRGERDWHHHLWDVLMFQAWLERWG